MEGYDVPQLVFNHEILKDIFILHQQINFSAGVIKSLTSLVVSCPVGPATLVPAACWAESVDSSPIKP